jgi:UDP-galactopyranose mutase
LTYELSVYGRLPLPAHDIYPLNTGALEGATVYFFLILLQTYTMTPDIVCFSHLRWDFVYQRPQHVMTGLSVKYRVLFIEEPYYDSTNGPEYRIYRKTPANALIVVPHLPPGLSQNDSENCMREIVNNLFQTQDVKNYILWYYSPMMVGFTGHLDPVYTIYDCMDELSAFLFAPPALKECEQILMKRADIVFTGGLSLYEAKRKAHGNIHCFPSSIDKNFFLTARLSPADPIDQRDIPSPRIGFYGVIDERLNVTMLDRLAELRPDWHFILIGPVVKIDAATLPAKMNIHYLGGKKYAELPPYLGNWDIAMMPFALNASTEFISPTKTPEYLAGGKPVISPSIKDVVTTYGDPGLVHIADTAEEFISVAERILNDKGEPVGWLQLVDEFLANMSWDNTVRRMEELIEQGIGGNENTSREKNNIYV